MECGEVVYWVKFVDVIELNYGGLFMVPLFTCEWAYTIDPNEKRDN
jgi:hypothetical protein